MRSLKGLLAGYRVDRGPSQNLFNARLAARGTRSGSSGCQVSETWKETGKTILIFVQFLLKKVLVYLRSYLTTLLNIPNLS